jgi:hypothetical protein
MSRDNDDRLVLALTLFLLAVSPLFLWGGWRAEYFNNPNLSGQPVLVRNDHILRQP